MGRSWTGFKRFLTAEEVPRWFGLSVVLIYLVGLGSVAQFGIVQARREGSQSLQRCSRYAVQVLAENLSALQGAGPDDPELVHAYQRALREFAANVPTLWLRVVDDRRRVVASTNPTEIGTRKGQGDVETSKRQDVETSKQGGISQRLDVLTFRLDVNSSRSDIATDAQVEATASDARRDSHTSVDSRTSAASDDGKVTLYLQASLSPTPLTGSSVANQARILAIVLVVLGALFVVYRCLREQLRGMSRIADRLELHRDRLEENLGSLHIADTLDGVTAAWNQLIELTQHLLEMVRRSDANEELSRVLQRSGGGALGEVLSALPDGIVYIVDETRFEYLNAAACRLFGWSAEEAGQTTLPEAKAEGIGAKVLDLVREALQADGSFEGRTELLDTEGDDGKDRSSYRVRVIPLQGGNHHGECVVVIRDVSQQIRAERAREEFITQVTHELRTPLTNIRAYTETLSSGMFDDPSVITECYNVITKETRRLSRLVEDVLSASQLEVGTIEIQIGNVDLKTLLGDGVRDVRGLADKKSIDLQLVLPDKLEPIQADRDKLAVVINNLLGNAIKYTPSNGNVVVGCRFTGSEVVISVKDNGIGISSADHVRVFEKFQRAADPDVQNQTGTGIGLYSAAEIVRRHRGEIELISEKGQGSTFLVHLPHTGTRAAVLTTAKEA